jgi:hypothetical protein
MLEFSIQIGMRTEIKFRIRNKICFICVRILALVIFTRCFKYDRDKL